MADNNYTDILLEDIRDQNKAVLEFVGSMKDHVKHIPQIRDDIEELKNDVKVIKMVLKDTNKQVQKQEPRIAQLEARL